MIRFKKKLKDGDNDIFDLINRSARKFESNIMIAGGISFYGLSHIIFVEGATNDFSYGQTLLFYKENIEEVNKNNHYNITLEQDGANCCTSKVNINLFNELFGKKLMDSKS